MLTLRTPARHLGHFHRSWQFGWLGIKPVDPMPMNRQERESAERSVKDQVLASLAKDQSATPASENAFLGLLKTWALPLVPLLAVIIGWVYWQFFFDFKTSVNNLIANNKTISALDGKINGVGGQPGMSVSADGKCHLNADVKCPS
jgi:hypothetical protein